MAGGVTGGARRLSLHIVLEGNLGLVLGFRSVGVAAERKPQGGRGSVSKVPLREQVAVLFKAGTTAKQNVTVVFDGLGPRLRSVGRLVRHGKTDLW